MSDLQSTPSPLSITVAILTANRDDFLNQLLHEIIRQLAHHDEVIVLDTASSETTSKVVEDCQHPRVHYRVSTLKSFDYAAARNELLRFASNEVVAFIDDDAFPFPDWLDRIRLNLSYLDAAGGPSVAAGALPLYWDHEINWLIGLSPVGVVLKESGFYPSSGNLAIRTAFAKKHPFQELPRNSSTEPIGREDAQWWMDCRLRGDNIGLDYRQAVSHIVHPSRLSSSYTMRRAMRDGFTDALRDATADKLKAAATNLGRALVKGGISKHYLIEINRLHGQIKASSYSDNPVSKRKVFQLVCNGISLQAKIQIGDIIWPFIRSIRSKPLSVHPLRKIYISADCLLGDTVFLRRHIQAVATTFENAEIFVTAGYPELLTGLEPNVKIIPMSLSKSQLLEIISDLNLAIVPYYHHGNVSFYRKHLAAQTTTFDQDVGFKRRRDYLLARHTVNKNMDLHEHENLARLFRILPLTETVHPDAPTIPDDATAWWQMQLEYLKVPGQYLVVHLGAGYQSKDWPVEHWHIFLQKFLSQYQLPAIIIGGSEKNSEGDALVNQLQKTRTIHNFTGKTTVAQLCAIISQAAFFIGACSGPSHIAMMYDVPTYTLYTATEPYRWGATENFHLHAYSWALKQKLAAPELLGRPIDFRAKLLHPDEIATRASHHFHQVMHREKRQFSSDSHAELS